MTGFTQSPVVYRGTIYNATDTTAVSDAHIYLIPGRYGVISDYHGQYTIQVTPGDTLVVSAMGLQTVYHEVPDTFTADAYQLNFWMKPALTELDPTTIYPFKDRNGLRQMLLTMDVEEPAESVRLHLPTFRSAPKFVVVPFGFRAQLDALLPWMYKKFDKITPQKEEIARWQGIQTIRGAARNRLNPDYVQQLLNISGDTLNKFMQFCKLQPEKIATLNDHELGEEILLCYQEFMDQDIMQLGY